MRDLKPSGSGSSAATSREVESGDRFPLLCVLSIGERLRQVRTYVPEPDAIWLWVGLSHCRIVVSTDLQEQAPCCGYRVTKPKRISASPKGPRIKSSRISEPALQWTTLDAAYWGGWGQLVVLSEESHVR